MKHWIFKLTFPAVLLGSALTARAADKKATGTVSDSDGEPLIGATVQVSGTSTGISTDIDGRFELTVPVGKTLKVTYVGYVPATEKITDGKDVYNFTLSPDATSLDDVVVVGYGVQKRSEVTGSISTVKGDQIRDFSVNSVADALSGMSAGVSVTKSTGSPGEAPDILIRGAGSINGMPPLYIVDGVKQGTGFNFNMRDVESIEVLKDAGSCAIYGAEAAGGVILVTTKRGSAGAASLSLTARYGFRKVNTDIRLMNRDQFIQAKAYTGVDILAYEGVTSASELPDNDWMDTMYDTGQEQEYMLALSGGSDKIKYYVSGGYYKEKGTYLDSSADRWSMRVNVDYNINRYISVGTSSYGSVQKTNPTRTGTIYT
ncbi:MAG: TonB-dependent receptor plug domain-containing protein, partial [Muribaculaceae bacterium]|nr:TonB-dependent receptor plug domain-containing protein [Muribaculaceae bacterium]